MTEHDPPRDAIIGNPANWGPERTREIHWHDPTATLALAAGMSGIDYLTAIKDGRLPDTPVGQLAGMTALTVEPGEVEFRCDADASFLNPIGLVHGGLLCTVLDSVLGCAVHTLLRAGDRYATVELKVSFLRPVLPDQTLRARGWVVKPGRRIAFSEGIVTREEDGEAVATASSSLAIDARAATPER